MKDKLNTLDSFLKEGFKIERNGEVITLTRDEMTRFAYLNTARWGRYTIENIISFDDNYKFAEQYLNDAEICWKVQVDYEEEAAYLDEELQTNVAKEYLDGYRDEE